MARRKPTPKRPTFVLGQRVTVHGLHKNYRPTIISINGTDAVLACPELPNCEPVKVKLDKLEPIE